MNIIEQVRLNKSLVFLSIASTLILGVSFSLSFAGHTPCWLCKVERIPYLLILLFSLIGIFSLHKTLTLKLILITLIASLFLASYHSALQLGYIKDRCTGIEPKNMAEFEDILFNQKGCKSNFKIAGLPLPYWNFLVSFTLLVVTSIACYSRKNRNSYIYNDCFDNGG